MSGAPGTPPDVVGRLYATALSESLGVPVVVENKPGIGSVVAMTEVDRAPADGYTLLYAVNNVFTVNPLVVTSKEDRRPAFVREPLNVFTPIGTTLEQGLVLIANKDVPAMTFKELMAHVKSKPGASSYGSYGAGSLPHLAMEMIAERNDLQLIHVPYKGGVLNDLIAGHIHVLVEPIGTALPHIQSGKVKALAYTGSQRHRALAEVPTLRELASGEAVFGWHAIWTRAGTPEAVRTRLASEMLKVSRKPEIQQRLRDLGYEPLISDPRTIVQRLTAERADWAKLIKSRHIDLTQ